MKRPESSFIQFRARIPSDVIAKARGRVLHIPIGETRHSIRVTEQTTHLRFSLRTRDPAEGKVRCTAVKAFLDRTWEALKAGPQKLSQRNTEALAGELYTAWVAAFEENPGTPERWQRVLLDNAKAATGQYGRGPLLIGEAAQRARSLEDRFGAFVDAKLAERAMVIDDESRGRLLDRVALAMQQAARRLEDTASGDYSPDETARRFPEWREAVAPPAAASRPAVTLSSLSEGWKKEAEGGDTSPSTVQGFTASFRKFREFLGHDDAATVTPADVVAFKDFRLASINPRTGKPLSPKTVGDADMVALKVIFGWGVDNAKITLNPAERVRVRKARKIATRDPGFSDDEAATVLSAALRYERRPAEKEKTALARRWVPWLCAYTGARVGEIAQLRREDVRQVGGLWIIHITPEAGTTKSGRPRDVVLHRHLIRMGFHEVVGREPAGHLFFDVGTRKGASTDPRGAWKGAKNRVCEFARSLVPDKRVLPNHAWRHRFKTVARSVDFDASFLAYVQGHKAATVGDTYGVFPLVRQAEEIDKMPEYREG